MTMILRNDKGMGLIMAVTLLAVFALSIGLLAPALYEVTVSDKTLNTRNDLQAIKVAIVGNPDIVDSVGRSDFGYVGTMGNPPSQLSDLWLAGSQPAYTFKTAVQTGAGWTGPYLPTSFAEDLLALSNDRFGNPFTLTTVPFTRSSDGQTVAARIQGAGPDGILNTADDQIQDILNSEVYATVTGTLVQGNAPVPFAGVALNYPSNGTFTSTPVTTDMNGIFTFNHVSFGFRSVRVSPLLLYKSGSVNDGGNSLQFTVTNAGTNDVTITSITPTWNQGTGYYEKIIFAGSTVFDYRNDTTPYLTNPLRNSRAQMGQTIYFQTTGGAAQPIIVKGSHKVNQSVPVRVDQTLTTTPNIPIAGMGQSVNVQLQNFNTSQTEGGSAVNIAGLGITFTVTFSDGSVNVIAAP
jgi:hypothetical protein